MRFPRGTAITAPRRSPEIAAPIGKGEVLRRGSDAALVCVGSMVEVARGAADLLANAGISAAVIDAKFVKPLDAELLLSIAAESRIVFALEESARGGGFGGAILEFFSERAPETGIVTIGLPDRFVPHGQREDLLAEVGLSAEAVAAEVFRFIAPRAATGHGGTR
jgi:1-deoxy-D-xylulose-5-phosphate synthase